VLVVETARVGALARSFDLNETDQRLADDDGEIRTGLDVGQGRLTHELDRSSGQPADFREVFNEGFKRTAQLIFRRAGNGDAGELRLDACSVSRNRARYRLFRQGVSPNFAKSE
jgi:hypothetical protein